MSKTELLIIVLFVYVTIVSVFLWVALKKIEKIEKDRNQIYSGLFNQTKSIMDLQKAVNNLLEQEKILEKQYETIEDCYGIISHSYDQMTEAFHMVSDQHKELLKAWEKIENRYSDCFEVLNGLRKSWDETKDQIETALQPWFIDSDDIYSYEKLMNKVDDDKLEEGNEFGA